MFYLLILPSPFREYYQKHWSFFLWSIVQNISSKPGLISMRLCHFGGYSAENFFEARFNFNEIMSLELFNQGIGLQVCINTSNFCHGATLFLYLPASMDTRPSLIYGFQTNKQYFCILTLKKSFKYI
jgi:hypothetical protein